jgi:hypothetical protein
LVVVGVALAIGAALWTSRASAEPVGLIEEFDVGGRQSGSSRARRQSVT